MNTVGAAGFKIIPVVLLWGLQNGVERIRFET